MQTTQDVDPFRNDDQRHNIRWTAPEIFRGSPTTKESDIFSFGMVMIEVGGDGSVKCQSTYPLFKAFTGKVPFSGMPLTSAMSSIANGGRPGRPDHPDFAEPLWTLTQRCWSQDPQDRPDIQEVTGVLKDLSAFDSSFER